MLNSYEKSFDQNLDTAYLRVQKVLEGNGFKVVYEIDMLENLTKFAQKNAVKDFNLNELPEKRILHCLKRITMTFLPRAQSLLGHAGKLKQGV